MSARLARRHLSRLCAVVVVVCTVLVSRVFAQVEEHILDDGHRYVTRPDIDAPRWEVFNYEPELISPGYWFVETYDYLDQSHSKGGLWNAPHIFDGNGELIWSGAYLSQKYDSFDFRISNVLGEDMLTWLYPRDRTAYVLDKHYNIQRKFKTSSAFTELDNMHDLQFVDNGTKALYFYDKYRVLSKARSNAFGFHGSCRVLENGFRERDVKNDSVIFTWLPSDHIDIMETTYTPESLDHRCYNGWDFLHANSLDKFPDDGSYLLSARYTDAIYKIDPNGTIIWRLGGLKSDFEADFAFLRQHHARIHEHNSTHTIMSVFDNAKAEDTLEPLVPYSRGVLFTLHTSERPMRATLIAEYPHPNGESWYTLGRGNTQMLPNGNMFNCWVDSCLQSEHAPDGRVIMKAQVKQEWLKSYRSYKFDFVGLPHDPPDVHTTTDLKDDKTTTIVHVSWNGATEVAMWRFYKTDALGEHRLHLATMPRRSFETRLEQHGYSKYIMVDAIDRTGKLLGHSKIVETLIPTPLPNSTIDLENLWLLHQDHVPWLDRIHQLAGSPIAIVIFSLLCAAGFFLGVWLAYRFIRKNPKWWRWNRALQTHELQYMKVEDEEDSLVEQFEIDEEDDDSEDDDKMDKLR